MRQMLVAEHVSLVRFVANVLGKSCGVLVILLDHYEQKHVAVTSQRNTTKCDQSPYFFLSMDC